MKLKQSLSLKYLKMWSSSIKIIHLDFDLSHFLNKFKVLLKTWINKEFSLFNRQAKKDEAGSDLSLESDKKLDLKFKEGQTFTLNIGVNNKNKLVP